MSLISRMLLDLEQRQSLATGDPVLAGLSSVDYCAREQHRTRTGQRWILLAVVPAAMALLVYLVQFTGSADAPRPTVRTSIPAPVGEPVRAAARNVTAVPTPDPAFPSLKLDETLSLLARAAVAVAPAIPEPATAAPAVGNDVLISAVNVSPRDGFVDVIIALSDSAKYAAYPLVAPDRLVLEISGARVSDGVARTFDSGPVKRLRARVERGVAMLVFDLQDSARIESAVLDDGAEPSLHLVLALASGTGAEHANTAALAPVADVITPGTPGDMNIQPVRVDRGPAALYRKGAQQMAEGRLAAGLATLSEVLAQDPSHVEGRRLMATVLMQQGDREQAASVLDAGLQKFPHAWQWAQLRAQIAIADGDNDHALSVLSAAPPATAEQREYHALLAAMQQRAGQHAQAVNTYHAILGREPGRGVWWMGLGISLQALQRTREAGFAFTRALQDTTLAADLRSFIQARKAALPEGDSA